MNKIKKNKLKFVSLQKKNTRYSLNNNKKSYIQEIYSKINIIKPNEIIRASYIDYSIIDSLKYY